MARGESHEANTASTAARNCRYGSSGAGPVTIREYDSLNRRRESSANSAEASAVSASSTASLNPRSSSVSIIPGIDTAAPERTLTNSGRGPLPNLREVAARSEEHTSELQSRQYLVSRLPLK